MKICEWRKVLDIIAKYSKSGEEDSLVFHPEHGIIYFNLTLDQIPYDSEDGKFLDNLGCHVENDMWACFVSM